MRTLSSAEFERVLHPVFEEDELTLILIGALRLTLTLTADSIPIPKSSSSPPSS